MEKVKFTYTVPQAAYAASAALFVSDRSGDSLSRSSLRAHGLCPAATQPYIALVCGFSGLHPRSACKYMDYYSITNLGGMEG